MSARDLTPEQRRALEATASPAVLLAFAMVEHPALAQPIRVVSDVLDYLRDGVLWQGVLFRLTLPTDGEEAPSARISLPNVDRRIGLALRSMPARAQVTLEVCSSADFDLSLDPREPLGPVTPLYPPIRWELVEIEGDAAELSGRLMLRDYAQEPWPRVFATEDRLPGLFR